MAYQILPLFQKIKPLKNVMSLNNLTYCSKKANQYSIRIYYCFQSMGNSKNSTMSKLATNHFLNHTIRSVNTAQLSIKFLKTVSTYIGSTFAVASSMTRILFLLNSVLAKHINCRWPTLKLEPPSDTSAFNPSSRPKITCLSCTCYKY